MADGCLHCPDGHANARSRPWGVYVSGARDGDNQPTTIHVVPSNGAHVAESDAEWIRRLINGDHASASEIVSEVLAPLTASAAVADYQMVEATRRAERAEAAIARVRRLCQLTITTSGRAQAIDIARDILTALDDHQEIVDA